MEVYAIDLNSDGSTAGIYNPIIYSGTITFTKEPSISISTNALTVSSDGTQTPYSVDVDTNNTGNYHIISDSDWLKYNNCLFFTAIICMTYRQYSSSIILTCILIYKNIKNRRMFYI